VRLLEGATAGHSGPISVLGGVLLVEGIAGGTGGVTVGAGGTLAGSGTLGGSLLFNAGSTLSPGGGGGLGTPGGLAAAENPSASLVPEPGPVGAAVIAILVAAWHGRRRGRPRPCQDPGFVVRWKSKTLARGATSTVRASGSKYRLGTRSSAAILPSSSPAVEIRTLQGPIRAPKSRGV